MNVPRALVRTGNTVMVIEHNVDVVKMDVVKRADTASTWGRKAARAADTSSSKARPKPRAEEVAA